MQLKLIIIEKKINLFRLTVGPCSQSSLMLGANYILYLFWRITYEFQKLWYKPQILYVIF